MEGVANCCAVIANSLEANNAGAKAAISAAIASYRASASVALRVAASIIVEDLASFIRMPLIIMVDPALTNPRKKEVVTGCLIDEATGKCTI